MGEFKFKVLPLAALACTAFSNVATAAESERFATCRDQATVAADQWSAGYVERAWDADQPKVGQYVAIVYGNKYFVPRKPAADGDLHLHPVGEQVLKRNRVYREEFVRCLGVLNVDLFVNATSQGDGEPTLSGSISSPNFQIPELSGYTAPLNYQ